MSEFNPSSSSSNNGGTSLWNQEHSLNSDSVLNSTVQIHPCNQLPLQTTGPAPNNSLHYIANDGNASNGSSWFNPQICSQGFSAMSDVFIPTDATQRVNDTFRKGPIMNWPGFPPQNMDHIICRTNQWPNGRVLNKPLPPGATWTNNTASETVQKQKRNRTAFTTEQAMELEKEFSVDRYLNRERRLELANILKMTDKTIKVWFQNRRMKEKKEAAERRQQYEVVSTTNPPSHQEDPSFVYENVDNEGESSCEVWAHDLPPSSAFTGIVVEDTVLPMPQVPIPPVTIEFSDLNITEYQPYQYDGACMQADHYSSPFSDCFEVSPPSVSSNIIHTETLECDNNNPDLSWSAMVHMEL